MKIPFLAISICILSGLLLLSCNDDSCIDETEAYLKISFFNNTSLKLAAPDSLTVYGLNKETDKLYKNKTNVQPALLPLNAAAENCTYIIRINGITDTLKLTYSNYPHLISKECGYTFFHDLVTDSLVYTTAGIDSIKITKNSITTANEENLRIFY